MECSRREACAMLALLAGAPAIAADQPKTLPSQFYNFDDLPVKHSGNLTYRNIFSGTIYEGCHISLHESELAPNSAPHPPHHHRHEEMVLIVDGVLDFTINGKTTRADAGSAMFAGSNDTHGIFNPGSAPAKYFVFALGPENQ